MIERKVRSSQGRKGISVYSSQEMSMIADLLKNEQMPGRYHGGVSRRMCNTRGIRMVVGG